MEDLLPPGFRFYPTEEELLSFYLHHKLEGKREDLKQVMDRVIPVLDIYDFNPWDLPQLCGDYCHGDQEQWFFFIPRQEREVHGGRPNRLTDTGYWKSTGSPCVVYSSNNRCIGVKRTMVFYKGRVPNGRKTEWKMNEYKAIQGEVSSSASAHPVLKQEFYLCRVYKKAKCLRSFDRRPLGVAIGQMRTDEQGHDDEERVKTRQNPPMVEGRCSIEGSFSEDQQPQVGCCSQSSEEKRSMPVSAEHDHLLGGELGWFYGTGEDINLE
ncbi:hypothetical protein P3X46_004232 [Hevea brasiliensis]|uniref:NAC domain-containing protein n=1 Tax=Hevea brasiliensis TaxID=3981 RepID=A0ABQ9MW39_HEVBR|nr:NAC domain-containing protein 90-like [Hevea brasiliensis]KAJ9184517.1 hypothetical protein P3X46_004232 [Hevea brasiliensis]